MAPPEQTTIVTPVEEDELEPIDLTARDQQVLQALKEGGEARVAFQGLKRRLGFHQEILARVLHRLGRDRLIEKSEEGYALSSRGRALLRRSRPGVAAEAVPVLQTFLPPDVQPEQLVAALRDRWFGNVRWYGFAHQGDEVVLSWVTADGRLQLTARIARAFLTVEAHGASSLQLAEAVKAGHALLHQIVRAYEAVTGRPGLLALNS